MHFISYYQLLCYYMPKKKKNDSAPIRALQNVIRLDNNKITPILISQMKSSKLIYNQALYCQRIWYSVAYTKFIALYTWNIKLFLIRFSTRDKEILFKEYVRLKMPDELNILLSYVRHWEYDTFNKLLVDAKIKLGRNYVLNNPTVVNDVEKIDYYQDFQTITDLIRLIKPFNFKLYDRKYTSFMTLLCDSVNHKIINQKNTLIKKEKQKEKEEKQKEKKEKQKEKKENVKKKEDKPLKINLFHLIPSSYLNLDIVEEYVKLYFQSVAEKRSDRYNPCDMIGSNVLQQTLKKLNKAFESFFGSLIAKEFDNSIKPSPPNYLTDKMYVLIFQKSSFLIINKRNEPYVRLSLGLIMKKKIKKADPSSKGYLWFKIPKYLIDKEIVINEIEITPCNDTSIAYITYKYKINAPAQKNRPIDIPNEAKNDEPYNTLAIDCGMVNLITIVSLLLKNPIIYKGGYILYVNRIYKYLIEQVYQPALAAAKTQKNKNKIRAITEHIGKLWRRREMIIKDYFNKITRDLIDRCVKAGINEIIIGYNINWKTNIKIGRRNNDAFYKIPYRELIKMIFNKAEEVGIKVKEHEESYTSKCDSLNWEGIGMHNIYSGKRIKRGLFSSAKGVYINADVNGALNILRKGLSDNKELTEQLKEGIKDYKRFCNPKVIEVEELLKMKFGLKKNISEKEKYCIVKKVTIKNRNKKISKMHVNV